MPETLDLRRRIRSCPECGQRFSPDAAFCPFDGQPLAEATWDGGASDPLVGQVVDGRYEVHLVLGEGGMGKVYRVRHVSLDRAFAMKVLRPDIAREEELALRFIQEARATASVRHPNIVSITDFGRLADQTPYFVMELLDGETLGQTIKRGGPVPAARAVRILRQIASALAAAHRAQIVHRDLKPDNVFLIGGFGQALAPPSSDPGGRGVRQDDVRVVDFGAAKVAGKSRLTKTGIVFGTPHYMSPEQASGQEVDHRADIYALGIIMYEMFTGRVPFEADTYMGVLTQHMFVRPTPPSEVAAAARELGALEDITMRCLEKRPEDRYQSMDALLTDLDRHVRLADDGRIEIAGRRAGLRAAPVGPYKLADHLEPPTLEELRAAGETLSPPLPRRRWPLVVAFVVVTFAASALAAFLLTRAPPPGEASPAPAAGTLDPGVASGGPRASAVAPLAPPASSAPRGSAGRSVLVVAVPPALLLRDGIAVGPTPVAVPVDPGAPAVRVTLRADGYVDQEVELSPDAGAELRVALRATKIARGARTAPPMSAAPPKPPPGPDEDPNPWKRSGSPSQ